MNGLFHNRQDAGNRLATRLADYAGKPGVIVLGLPRGGVPVAYEIAFRLMSSWCANSECRDIPKWRWERSLRAMYVCSMNR